MMISKTDYLKNISCCTMCPKNCKTDRKLSNGFCGAGENIIVSKIMFHKWEEPAFCFGKGVGAVFFGGCNIRCIFCQNAKISRNPVGEEFSPNELSEIFFKLQNEGASAIDLVSPTHYSFQIAKALENVKEKLTIPVVWNSGGYEKAETLKYLDGLVDIYLPDFKYIDPDTAFKFSGVKDYPDICKAAIEEMVKQKKTLEFFDDSHLKSGVIVRHLCLPGHRRESIEIINYLAQKYNSKQMLVSLMSQYTPVVKTKYKELNRQITTFEYKQVQKVLEATSFDGFEQQKNSSSKAYIPDF